MKCFSSCQHLRKKYGLTIFRIRSCIFYYRTYKFLFSFQLDNKYFRLCAKFNRNIHLEKEETNGHCKYIKTYDKKKYYLFRYLNLLILCLSTKIIFSPYKMFLFVRCKNMDSKNKFKQGNK